MPDAPAAALPAVLVPTFAAALRKLWPHGNDRIPGLIDGIIAAALAVFPKYGITSPLLVAHAFAQFSEECGCGLEMQENMNYSAGRLLAVFPTHFTHEQAIALQHNPRAIADHAYGGRMGNLAPPSDDGWNFRGQGLSQVTGKDGYHTLALRTGLDLLNHPEMIIAPPTALECGIADFVLCGCLPYAQKDSLIGVSSMLNVGHFVSDPGKINGYQTRKSFLALWKHAMGVA
jgi:putative chitinase